MDEDTSQLLEEIAELQGLSNLANPELQGLASLAQRSPITQFVIDVASMAVTGGIPVGEAIKRVGLANIPRVIRSEVNRQNLPKDLSNVYFSDTVRSGVGQLVNPEDLVSVTDERGADTGFSEYSSPGVAASYEGSF